MVHRGVRAVRGWGGWGGWVGWWWAAVFALILTSIGAGVNAAVVGWMLVGPLVLLLYEPAIGTVRWRDSAGFLARVGLLGVLASLWWIVPLLVHVQYGIDFLQFTEQPRSIWGTNSITESLRLMGYWTSYIGTGFGATRPLFSDSATMLFNPLVVVASLLLPALAVAGFVWTRRWRYGPFLLLLAVVGVLIMMAGFPDGTPLRSAMEWVYRNVFVLRFMRTTQKAAPLVAVGMAGLLGLGAQQAWGRLRALEPSRVRAAARIGAPAALAALIVLAALPLVRGQALDTQLRWKRIPAAWTSAGRGLDHELPPNTRALVLPGSIFAFYRWGGTVDAILPRLTDRPVAVRYETPYSDLHAVDLLTTVDSLVQQRRLVPGQLPPLLRLMGVGAVVTGADDDITRSGALDPAAAAGELGTQGLGRPSRVYGPAQSYPPASGDIGTPAVLPQVRRYDVPAGRGIVHVDPLGPATVVDGGAGALADMAAFGSLPSRSPILYAGDLSTGALQQQAARGADVVVSDSNRRRPFLPAFSQQNLGATLSTTDPIDQNSALINPFPQHGTDTQTVSALLGARYLRAPAESGSLQFPEHGPLAAFDEQLATSWVADGLALRSSWWAEIGFNAPRDVPYVDVYPLSGSHGVVDRVDVNGVRSSVGLGWTRIPVHLRHVTAVRVHIDHVIQPKVGLGGAGGFREIRIPGVHVRQILRAPIVVGRALAGRDLRHDGLTYLFDRTTGDNPFLRDRYAGDPVLGLVEDRGDAERYIDRTIFAPTARSYTSDAWLDPAVDAPDSALDRLAGAPRAVTFDSSSRFHDQARYRASSAFDGRADTAWVGVWVRPEAALPWISWTTSRPRTVSRLRLAAPQLPVRHPTLVQLSWRGGATPPLSVMADGAVVLPRPAHARAFRLTILAAQFPPGVTRRQRTARAVGIASLSVPGLAAVDVPRQGPLRAACGSVRIQAGAHIVPLEPYGTIAQLDAGQPLPARACGGSVALGSGIQEIRSLPGPFSVDLLRLHSAPPAPAAVPAPPAGASAAAGTPPSPLGGGTVTDSGHLGRSSVTGVRVALSGPSWLVLGESFDRGWRATCDGRSLGLPQVVDGYADGWLAPANCRSVAFSFAPQSGVRVSYLVSALTCLLLAAFLLGGLLRGRRVPVPAPAPLRLLPDSLPQRVPARAVALASRHDGSAQPVLRAAHRNPDRPAPGVHPVAGGGPSTAGRRRRPRCSA